MAYIFQTSTAFPSHYYSQTELTAELLQHLDTSQLNPRLLTRLHQAVKVKGRHLAVPPSVILTEKSFTKRNSLWIAAALELGKQCLDNLFSSQDIEPVEIKQLIFTTVTGLSVPSIDAKLMNLIPFSPHLKRVPLFGLGCVAGAAGISRAADYLRGHPNDSVVLLSIELCSLTFQLDDLSIANFVSTGLFGDGAAAVLLVGEKHRLNKNCPLVVANQSTFFKNTEHVMGWDIGENGFKIVLSADVPKIALEMLPNAISQFLSTQDLKAADISIWISHPGGPKVIDAIEKCLNLSSEALSLSRESLATIGNLSSASVLAILQKTLKQKQPLPGTYGLLMAMGPGFCVEMVLLKW
jgi:alkylresorcinol/alkylpyrone synthase